MELKKIRKDGLDNPEQIQECLNCKYAACINCIGKRQYWKKLVQTLSNEEIAEMIMHIVDALDLHRMPRYDEIIAATGSGRLLYVIEHRGGFEKWAAALGLKIA